MNVSGYLQFSSRSPSYNKILILILILLAALFIYADKAIHTSAISDLSWIKYDSPDLGFAIEYPSIWNKQEYANGLFFVPKENNTYVIQGYFEVLVFPSQGHTISQLQILAIENLKRHSNFTLTESSNILLDKRPAYKLVYSYNELNRTVSNETQIGTEKDNKLYFIKDSIRFGGHETNLMVQKVIHSFKFTNSTLIRSIP